MKIIATLLAICLIASAGFAAYLFLTCEVSITSLNAASMEASASPELFRTLQAQMKAGASTGTVFSEDESFLEEGSMENYKFVTYHIGLRNTCYLPATSIEVQISPQSADIMQLLDTTQRLLPSQSEGVLDAVLLTRADAPALRELRVTYYMWGIPFTLKTLSGTT